MSLESVGTTAVPIIAAIVGLAGWYLRSRLEAVRRERERLQSERRELYIQILEPYIKAFSQPNIKGGSKQRSDTDLTRLVKSFDYRKASFELIFIGSDDVITALNCFLQHFYTLENNPSSDSDSIEGLHLFGQLLLCIRQDLGNRKTKLGETEVLEWLITDIRQLRPS